MDELEDSKGSPGDSNIFTVTDALMFAKGTLESLVIKVVGEVSEVSAKSGYKAVYFTIKDERSSLSCLIWNNRYAKLGIDLQVGQLVEIVGRFTVYAAKGRMNFEALSITLAGEGDLRMQVDRLAKKLAAQGYMDPDKKLPLPYLPQKIGLVTSPRGDAVHDVLRTLRRLYPVGEVLFAGVPVEGANAPAALMTGIRCVYDAGAEVILVVRGGGSYEDLMPFNDERLAITISRCPVPVVTGIGHEPDNSIADMVADHRASTPTAAAEAVSPQAGNLQAFLVNSADTMAHGLERSIAQLEHRVSIVEAHTLFKDSMRLFADSAMALDGYEGRIHNAIPRNLERDGSEIAQLETRLKARLAHEIDPRTARSDELRARLRSLGAHLTDARAAEFAQAAARLNDLSPLGVLARGYSIARDEQGSIVSKVGQVKPGDAIAVSVSDGVIDCVVNDSKNVVIDFEVWKDR